MKKRILAIVLGTAMTLSMVGCGETKEETPATTPDTKAPAASTEEAAAPAETAGGDRSDRKEFPVYILAGSC